MKFSPFTTGDGATSNVASFLLPMRRLDWFKQAVVGALSQMAYADNWFEVGDQSREIAAELAAEMIEGIVVLNFDPLPPGRIEAFAGVVPPGYLLCDGASYATASYPELFANIGYTWGGSGANFNVPDYRNRVIIGAGDVYNLADNGGEAAHTLTVAELAAHTHTATAATIVDPGHVHTEITAIPAVSTLGAGVPFPLALPGVGVTGIGFTGITALAAGISSAGSDTPHNNLQPYAAANIIIYAGR